MGWICDLPPELCGEILTSWIGLREIVKLDAACFHRHERKRLIQLCFPDKFVSGLVKCKRFESQLLFLEWIIQKKLYVLKVSIPSEADGRRRSMLRFFKHAGHALECVEFHGQKEVNNGTVIDLIAAHCPAIVKLSLRGWTKFNVIAMDRLFAMTHALRYLNFSECNALTVEIMHMIANSCPELRFLSLQSCLFLTNAIICRMAERMPQLQHLEIGDTSVSDAGLRAIAENCPDLRSLKVNSRPITDQALVALASKCTNLCSVDISGCTAVTDAGLRALIDIPNNKLKVLHLRKMYHINDALMVEIANKCPNLTYISVSHCFMLTDKGVMALARICKNLQCLEVSDTLHVTELSGHALGAKLMRLY